MRNMFGNNVWNATDFARRSIEYNLIWSFIGGAKRFKFQIEQFIYDSFLIHIKYSLTFYHSQYAALRLICQ